MSYKTIEIKNKNNILELILDRPEAGNSLNAELAEEFYDAVCKISVDSNIKAVIITGKGKLFCGGGDLNFLLSKKNEVKETLLRMTNLLHGAIARLSKISAPVLVGVNGTAGGGGFSLAITGDIIYAVKSAKFTLAYTNAGLSPDLSSTYYLPRLVGLKRAKELMLTNRVFSADEAYAMGIIDLVVDSQQELDQKLQDQAEIFSRGPKNAYSSVKKLLNISFSNGLETQMDLEGTDISENAQSTDGIEGMTAFKEKRSPVFKK